METQKHLETEKYIFFCDIEESDDNASTKMYDKEMNLISDNYFAGEYLWQILAGKTDEKIIFISDEMEYNRKEILKEVQEEDNVICDHDFIPVNNDGKHKCRFCGEIEN